MASTLDRPCKAIGACRICIDAPTAKPLPHEPKPVFQAARQAPVLLVGQAPGTRVHQSGRPFSDPSGDRLRFWLGVDADSFYDKRRFAIVPMGLCFPGLDAKGGDLPPRRECAPAWRPSLMKELKSVELIVCLGLHAQRWHMGDAAGKSLSQTVANWREGLKLSPPVFPLPHPSWRNNAWLKANPWFETDLLPVLRRQVKALVK